MAAFQADTPRVFELNGAIYLPVLANYYRYADYQMQRIPIAGGCEYHLVNVETKTWQRLTPRDARHWLEGQLILKICDKALTAKAVELD
jgi:hypothetical protein